MRVGEGNHGRGDTSRDIEIVLIVFGTLGGLALVALARRSNVTIELESWFLPNAEFEGYDAVPRRSGGTIDLAVIECDVHSNAVRMIEYGSVPGNYPLTILLAGGPKREFDALTRRAADLAERSPAWQNPTGRGCSREPSRFRKPTIPTS